MLERFIPDWPGEFRRLSELCNSGFIMGFGIGTRRNPDYLVNTFPEIWTKTYDERNYLFGDPTVLWILANDGVVRWSEINGPGIKEVFNYARTYGLCYGAVVSYKVRDRRCFLSMARNDREFTDEEMNEAQIKFQLWSQRVVEERPVLNEREIVVLRALRDGMDHAEISTLLAISVSTVRQRQTSAMHKLGAKTSVSAVGLACSYQLLDDVKIS